MDMSWSHVYGPTTVATQLATLFLLFYPFAIVLAAWQRRGWLAGSLLPVVLTPLFAGEVGGWSVVANSFGGLPLSGGGPLAAMAGLAESLAMVMFATLIATIVATASIFSPGPAAPRRVEVALAALAGALLLAHFAIAAAAPRLLTRSIALAQSAGWVALAGAVASLVCMLVQRPTPAPARRTLPIVATIVCAAACFTTWKLASRLMQIAMTGNWH